MKDVEENGEDQEENKEDSDQTSSNLSANTKALFDLKFSNKNYSSTNETNLKSEFIGYLKLTGSDPFSQ